MSRSTAMLLAALFFLAVEVNAEPAGRLVAALDQQPGAAGGATGLPLAARDLMERLKRSLAGRGAGGGRRTTTAAKRKSAGRSRSRRAT